MIPLKHLFHSHRLQGLTQIPEQLVDVVVILLLPVIFPKGDLDLRYRNACAVSVYQKGEQLFGFGSFEGQFLALGVNLEITKALHPQRLLPQANALDVIDLTLDILSRHRLQQISGGVELKGRNGILLIAGAKYDFAIRANR